VRRAPARFETRFTVTAKAPRPGLYARASQADLPASAVGLALDAVVWDGTTAVAPATLRAAASDGRLAVYGDKLVLKLEGKAPHMVAIAFTDGEHVGAAFLPVYGVATVPVESEPGSRIEFWVAGRWFGPVPTTGRRARIDIVVPPGVTHGVARSTGKSGYITDAITDLRIPARPRIAAVVGAEEVAAGARTVIAVAVAGAHGRPAAGSQQLVARATRGSVGAPVSLGGGLWQLTYDAPLAPGAEHLSIAVADDPTAGSVEIDLAIGGVSTPVRETIPSMSGFRIPGFVLGIWGNGAWVDNLGVMSSPRISAGVGVRSGGGRALELAARVGVEGLYFHDTTHVVSERSMDETIATRSVSAIGMQIGMRARVRVSSGVGLAVGAAVVPLQARVRLAPASQDEEVYGERVIAARGEVAADVALGHGRVVLAASYGRAPLTEGSVTGHIDGIAITAGYEWWLAEVGW
jgi:hypothetical protein